MRWVNVLIVWIEDARHAWSRGVAIEEGIVALPAITVRSADGAHFVAVQHDGAVGDVDDEGVGCVPYVAIEFKVSIVYRNKWDLLGLYLIILYVTILSKLSSIPSTNVSLYGFVSQSPPAMIGWLPPSVDVQEEADALPMVCW